MDSRNSTTVTQSIELVFFLVRLAANVVLEHSFDQVGNGSVLDFCNGLELRLQFGRNADMQHFIFIGPHCKASLIDIQ